MNNDKYWKFRAEQRMYEYVRDADRVADEIGKAYLRAAQHLESQMKKIFDTYRKGGGLSEAEARRILNDIGNDTNYAALKKAYNRVKDPEIKQRLLDRLNAPAYQARIRRLQELRDDLDRKCRELYKIETQAVRQHLGNTVPNAYYRTMYDIQRGTGYGFSFAQISTQRADEILRNNWSGASYSDRIWSNTQAVAELVKNELFVGQMVGKSYHDMTVAIMEGMGAGAMQARRLVRTESCYVANQAEMESYKECDIEKYRFVATLDLRTSDICASLDGEVFPVDKQQPGVNCPPMHPNCRSTTIAEFDVEVMKGLQRRARDPETGKNIIVPGNMTYPEWREKYVTGKEKTVTPEQKHGIIERKKRKQLPAYVDEKTALELLREETGYDVKTAKEVNDTLNGYFDLDYKEYYNGNRKKEEKIIDEALSQMPVYDGEIYRGLHVIPEQLEGMLENCVEGAEISMKSISSWSSRREVAEKFGEVNESTNTVIFTCKENKNAVGVRHLSQLGSAEDEVLAPTTSRWKITKIDTEIKSIKTLLGEERIIKTWDYRQNEYVPCKKVFIEVEEI